MPSCAVADYRWLSALGASVALFLLQSALTIVAYLVVFALIPGITTAPNRESGGFLLSGRMDAQFFGKSIKNLVLDNPQLLEIDRYTLYVRAGIWLALSIFQLALGWFGLRQGEAWAFWTIVLANIAGLAGWIAVILPFAQRRIPLGFDLPPVVLMLAAVILPISGILGWIGLR